MFWFCYSWSLELLQSDRHSGRKHHEKMERNNEIHPVLLFRCSFWPTVFVASLPVAVNPSKPSYIFLLFSFFLADGFFASLPAAANPSKPSYIFLFFRFFWPTVFLLVFRLLQIQANQVIQFFLQVFFLPDYVFCSSSGCCKSKQTKLYIFALQVFFGRRFFC